MSFFSNASTSMRKPLDAGGGAGDGGFAPPAGSPYADQTGPGGSPGAGPSPTGGGANDPIAAMQQMFKEGKDVVMPYVDAGKLGFGQEETGLDWAARGMTDLTSDLTTARGDVGTLRNRLTAGFDPGAAWDPTKIADDAGYKFRLQQGQAGVLAGAGATGSPWSGQAMKDLASFNQGLSATYENQDYSRYLSTRQQGYSEWQGQVNSLMGLADKDLGVADRTLGGINADLGFAGVGNTRAAIGGAAAGSIMGGANAAGANIANLLAAKESASAAEDISKRNVTTSWEQTAATIAAMAAMTA